MTIVRYAPRCKSKTYAGSNHTHKPVTTNFVVSDRALPKTLLLGKRLEAVDKAIVALARDQAKALRQENVERSARIDAVIQRQLGLRKFLLERMEPTSQVDG